jgi:hypothetical protein
VDDEHGDFRAFTLGLDHGTGGTGEQLLTEVKLIWRPRARYGRVERGAV